ncbi:MAG: hypothetical protein U5R06_20745 [candidate division KSB1 bacterium]|nr:hypothetical protein [candidate division KSB1 bacterium]
MDNLLTREKSGTQLHDLDDLLIVFLVIAAVSLLRGLLEGYAYYHVITEGVFILFYGFYFVFLRNKSLLQIKKLTMALVIFSFIVSIEYLLLTFQEGKIATIALQRIVTRQPYIALFTVPVLVSNIFFQKRIWIKILSIIAAFPIIAMVLISQWRGLWLGFLISSFAVVFLALNRDKFSFQKILKFIVLLILIMTTLVITILIIDQLFIGSAIVSLLNRGLSFTDVMGDDSIIMRISDTRRAWQQMQGSIVDILFGKGLGASYDRNSIYMTYPYQVDCTYIYIFWKMGLVGLLTFLLIGFKVFKKGFYAFKNTQDLFIKYITASLLSGFIGLYIASITSVCSIIYQFTIVWAFMISAVEIVYLKVRSEIIIPRRNNEQV